MGLQRIGHVLETTTTTKMVKNLLPYRGGRLNSWVGKSPLRRKWQHTPVFLLGKSHGQRSLAGYSPWSCRAGHDSVTEHEHKHNCIFGKLI